MFERICLWSYLVLDFYLLEVFKSQFLFQYLWLVCSCFLFFLGSVLQQCIFLRICPFLPGCPFYWHIFAHMGRRACLVSQSCLTLCNTMDCSLPGFSVHGILQVRLLEWVTISYSRESSWCKDWTHISCSSCTVRQILYHCAAWEAQCCL